MIVLILSKQTNADERALVKSRQRFDFDDAVAAEQPTVHVFFDLKFFFAVVGLEGVPELVSPDDGLVASFHQTFVGKANEHLTWVWRNLVTSIEQREMFLFVRVLVLDFHAGKIELDANERAAHKTRRAQEAFQFVQLT